MKYLKRSAGYIVLIIALLFLQAYCDLSLPDYTSKIINVGIQQNGVRTAVLFMKGVTVCFVRRKMGKKSRAAF